MSIGINKLLMSALRLIDSEPTFDGSAALGTTPVKVVLPDIRGTTKVLHIKITCLANNVAWDTVSFGGTAPTITATPGLTSGVIIPTGESEWITLTPEWDLYVVGSAAASSFSIACFVQ